MLRNEKQWRQRNPDLAARLDRLPKSAQANIRTAFTGNARGVSKIVRNASDAQRERKRANDARYRKRKRIRTLVSQYKTRAIGRAEFEVEIDYEDEIKLAWDIYAEA